MRLFPSSVFLLASCSAMHAGALFGTDLPANSGASASIGASAFVVQPFRLNVGVIVSSLDLQVAGTGVDTATIWITDAVGPSATPSDVLFQVNELFPDNGGGVAGETVSIPFDLTLPTGRYYIVMSSASLATYGPGPRLGWVYSTSMLPSPVASIGQDGFTCCIPPGAANASFAPASLFVPAPGGDIQAFQINGTTVPEPAPVHSLASTIFLFVLYRTRRRLKRG